MKKFFYSQKLAPYVFILPFVLTVIFFWAVPIANGVLLSFQDVLQDKWVGLDNYKRLLSDKIFLKALFNSTRYMIGTLVLLIPFPMLFATLLNSKLMKKPGFFKSIYFLPALTSVVVAGTIFRLMFGEMETSLANQVIGMFGLGPIKWLKNDLTGYFALLLLACWRWTGVNILYFLAGLQSISTDLYEAASIDGANKWQIYFKIMFPQAAAMFGSLFLMLWIADWNNYSTALIYLSKLPTLAVGIYKFQLQMTYSSRMDILYAACTISLLPPLIIFIFFNNALMSNVSIGGIKE